MSPPPVRSRSRKRDGLDDRRPGLWAEPRSGESDEAWAAPRRKTARKSEQEPAPERERQPRVGWWTLRIAVVVPVLVALAIALSGVLNGEDHGGLDAPLLAAPGGRVPETTAGRVYAAVERSVVSVRVGSASGTGFVVSRDGTIVTNSHVIGSRDGAKVRFGGAGSEVDAEVLGTDASTDLAALRVDPDEAGDLRPLALADSEAVDVGDSVVAVGNPFGLDRTATAGIVSGVGREIRAPNGFQIDEVIQTDAPINPGNSGGPLVDVRGRVIGVNSQIATAGAGGGNVGIGFAVPSNTARKVVPRLVRGEPIKRPFMGVTTAPGAGGASVVDVIPGGPADRGGILPGEDVIVRIGGQVVREPEDVSRAIARRKPGDTVRVVVERDGERRELEVTLGTRPERTP